MPQAMIKDIKPRLFYNGKKKPDFTQRKLQKETKELKKSFRYTGKRKNPSIDCFMSEYELSDRFDNEPDRYVIWIRAGHSKKCFVYALE